MADGKKLGNISDIDIDLQTGKIEAIIISGSGGIFSFFSKEEEVVIPWRNILKIGEDVILVRFKEKNDFNIVEPEEE